MATAMQPAINPLGVSAGGWPALLNQKNSPFKPSFAAIKYILSKHIRAEILICAHLRVFVCGLRVFAPDLRGSFGPEKLEN